MAQSDKKTIEDRPKRQIPEKCKRCALNDMDWVREVHGGEKGCWDPKVCHARRSHARSADRRNASRRLKNKAVELQGIEVDVPDLLYAVLVVYRTAGVNSRVHAIAAEIWNERGRIDCIKPRHCIGMTPARVEGHVQGFLEKMENDYGLKKFAAQERREVYECPVRPCPHFSAGRP